jgi:hypothetical protein
MRDMSGEPPKPKEDPNKAIYDDIARQERRTAILFGVIILIGIVGMLGLVARKLGWL